MAYLIQTFIAALVFGSSLGVDIPGNYSGDSAVGCITTQINSTDKQEDFAWVLKGLKNLVPQIGWAGLAEGNLTLETSVYSQKTSGNWSMKVGSFPGGGKMYLCLNYLSNADDEQLKISRIGAAIVSGNNSIVLRSPPKGPPHGRGPHPPHHPPHGPPHHPPHGPPHHPPHGPPHHPPHGPPHHPPHGPPHHPPSEPPHMMNKMDQNGDVAPPACQQIWFICPKQLEATFPASGMKDSDDDFAIVVGVRAVSIHTEESSGSPQDCQVPRFQDIASTDKTEDEDANNNGNNEDEATTVVNSGTTDMPRETSSPVPSP